MAEPLPRAHRPGAREAFGERHFSRLCELLEEGGGQIEGAQRVVEQSHTDAGPGALHQGGEEAPAGAVVADDVGLEVHVSASGRDRGEHRGNGLATAAQGLDLVVRPQVLLAVDVVQGRRGLARGRESGNGRAGTAGCGCAPSGSPIRVNTSCGKRKTGVTVPSICANSSSSVARRNLPVRSPMPMRHSHSASAGSETSGGTTPRLRVSIVRTASSSAGPRPGNGGYPV
jgi:hypothetical protein